MKCTHLLFLSWNRILVPVTKTEFLFTCKPYKMFRGDFYLWSLGFFFCTFEKSLSVIPHWLLVSNIVWINLPEAADVQFVFLKSLPPGNTHCFSGDELGLLLVYWPYLCFVLKDLKNASQIILSSNLTNLANSTASHWTFPTTLCIYTPDVVLQNLCASYMIWISILHSC